MRYIPGIGKRCRLPSSGRGKAKLVQLADGSHVVRLENLDTGNGPDPRMWLTDAPVKEGKSRWHVFDDGKYVGLGELKGDKGSQNYASDLFRRRRCGSPVRSCGRGGPRRPCGAGGRAVRTAAP
ncbi:hypothetical protein GCM10010103_61310 [Streptomyces paradoxus]